jgi:tetratricopeptide (TPR) repeat protein
MWQGILKLRRGEAAGAEDLLTEALALKQDYAMAWMWRGVARLERAQFEGAGKDLGEALKFNLGLTEAWIWRGVLAARRGRQASSLDPEGNFASAEADLTKALALDAGAAAAWLERSRVRGERAALLDRKGQAAESQKARSGAAEDRGAALRLNPAVENAAGRPR